MKTFITKTYQIKTEKLKGGHPVRFAVLADLHGLVFGNENQDLFHAIEKSGADAALVVGDMVVRADVSTVSAVTGFLCRLANRIPVFYALGNHEYKMLLNPDTSTEYLTYEHVLTNAGVCFLHNEHVCMNIRGTEFTFYGLELPEEYYRKPFSPYPDRQDMRELVGKPSGDGISVLLAHNPKYGDVYFEWGADFIFSGHYHGGILRFNEHHGLTCPQYLLFPPYCCGDFHRQEQHMIVSAGLGEHTIPVRIHNPRELILAELVPGEGGPGGNTAQKTREDS